MKNDIDILSAAANFIVKYGFLAVGLFLIFIISPVIYKRWQSKTISISALCFGLAFVISFGVLDLLQKHAPWLISSKRAMLTGVVRGIENGYQMQVRSDRWRAGQAYTKRENDLVSKNIYNSPFILVTPDSPKCIVIALSLQDKNYVFNIKSLPEDDVYFDQQIIAEVFEKKDGIDLKIWREKGEAQVGEAKTISPIGENEKDCGAKKVTFSEWSFFNMAYAQEHSEKDINEWKLKLKSDDVFIRRDARIDLSAQGAKSFANINILLDDNSYRVQLGAVSALSFMDYSEKNKMPDYLIAKVRKLLNHPDKTMRKSALLSLGDPPFCYQEKDKNKKYNESFLVLCTWSKNDCEKIRGPNNKMGITQSQCAAVRIDKFLDEFSPNGYMNSWYRYDSKMLDSPFPQLQNER